MKKIVVITTLFVMCISGMALALNLDGLAGTVGLSKGVNGTYHSDGTGTTARNFTMATGHTQGSFTYATGNFSTAIYKKAIAGAAYASTDLFDTVANTTYNSSALSAWGAEM